jgi:oligosaccharide repeat unit polymerase
MLVLAISILSVLAIVNYQIGNKGLFYPPLVFCLVWVADLVVFWIAGDFFYSLSAKTLSIFVCGCFAFSLGSWLTLFLPEGTPEKSEPLSASSRRILNLLVLLVVAALPLFYHWIRSITSGYGSNLLMAARAATLDEANDNAVSSLFWNLATLSIIAAMIAFYERGKKRLWIALGCTLILNLLTGGRSGVVTLILSLICIDWIKNRRLRWKPLAAMVLVFVISFGLIAIYVQKGSARADASLAENLMPVAQGFVQYAAGGLPAFSQVVEHPNLVVHNWQIYRPAQQMLNRLGARFDVPDLRADFLTVGPDGLQQNIYTLYFAYIDLGWPVTMFVMVGHGFLAALVYRRALLGGKVATLSYGYLFAELVLSPYNELLFMGMNFIVKLLLGSWVIYYLPDQWGQFRRFVRESVQADLKSATAR